MSSSSRTPRLGDIVLLSQGIGVIRYYGEVDWDDENKYFGVELKGPSISGGHNGTYNGKEYFSTKGGDGRGIFVLNPIRIISSEEILEKLAEIYDILKGRKGHSHFIDRATYDDLLNEHQSLQEQYQDKINQVEDLTTDLAIFKEKISMMKGTLGDKIDETAKMSDKIHRAEKKLGSRLSRVDLASVKKQLEIDNNDIEKQPLEIPQYSQQGGGGGHRKQLSSTTIDLDQLNDDFSEIAKTVQAYGQKNKEITGPTHYRRFSNTTKQIMNEHKKAGAALGQYGNMNGNATLPNKVNKGKTSGHRARGSMKIGDLVDSDGIDYDSDPQQLMQQRLERESENEDDDDEQNQTKRKVKTRASRQSRQLDDDEDFGNQVPPKRTVKSRASRESRQLDDDEIAYGDDAPPKRTTKSRASRESRQLDDEEVSYGNGYDDTPPKRSTKSRASRESRQLDDVEVNGDDAPPKRSAKSRSSRQSRQLDDEDIDNYGSEDEDEEDDEDEEEEDERIMTVQDDALGNNMQIDSSHKQVKRNKARGSFQVSQPVLSATFLETHNEHHMEEEAGQINGPKDGTHKTHKKSDTMTSDSSAYRAFMSVD